MSSGKGHRQTQRDIMMVVNGTGRSSKTDIYYANAVFNLKLRASMLERRHLRDLSQGRERLSNEHYGRLSFSTTLRQMLSDF